MTTSDPWNALAQRLEAAEKAPLPPANLCPICGSPPSQTDYIELEYAGQMHYIAGVTHCPNERRADHAARYDRPENR